MTSDGVPAGAQAALVDTWGRMHAFAREVAIGRRRGPGGIAIAEPSVSRTHARITAVAGGYRLEDLDSSNGTRRNGERVYESVALATRDIVSFGQVSFVFVSGTPIERDGSAERDTQRPVPSETLDVPVVPLVGFGMVDDDEEALSETFAGLRFAALDLVAPTGGGGGVLELDGRSLQLPLAQFDLVRVLSSRMLAEPTHDPRVRGFVRSSELAASLPWESARPDDNHIKQLVRRLRRSLTRAGLPDIVESRHGFGYRLRFIPRPVPRSSPLLEQIS